MFNIGLPELLVLAIVGLVVLGPERLPGLARDAAQMLRTLRELATGARQQLQDELGPEFADVDLRNLNPRTAIQRAVFGDEINLSKLNPRTAVRDAVFGDEDLKAADPRAVFRETRDEIYGRSRAAEPVSFDKAAEPAAPAATAPRPRPRPKPRATYDDMT